MKGILILIFSFIILYLLSKYTDLAPVSNVNDRFEYIPILTANIYADLLIIFITFTKLIGNEKSWDVLGGWYKKYRLSAMMADILIGVTYLLIARYMVGYFNLNLDLFQFGILAVIVQIFFDFCFYLTFISIPKGVNDMLDYFKVWAKNAEADALWGDSILVIFAVILSSYLNKQSFDFNIFNLILAVYQIPYFIYMKD